MSTHRLVQRLGLAIIALGLGAAIAVYFTARAGADAETDQVAQQREMRELQRLGGTATVQTVKFDRWLDSLWHGQRLAGTVAVLCLLVGGACWKIGGLMSEDLDADDTRA
jgi:hypothetical protein